MKPFKRIITIISIALFFTSCHDLLQETPNSFIEQGQYYTNKEQAISGVNGIYSTLTNSGGYAEFWQVAELTTDEGKTGGVYQPSETITLALDNLTFNAAHVSFDQVWNDHYEGINRANLAISQIPQIDSITEDLANRLVAEAGFLRALYYFNLIRWFGDIPLTTEPTDNVDGLQLPRTDKEQVYELIVSDLENAVQNLPVSHESGDEGRATKGAALTLLGKVNLTRENWQAASDNLQSVIDLNQYALFSDYTDVWNDSNENGKEFVFSVQYKAGIVNSPYSTTFAPRSSNIQAAQSFGQIAPTSSLLDKYPNDDERLQVFKDKYPKYNSTDTVDFGWPFSFKYFDLAEGGNSGQNFPLLRYADVLLMFAETSNELNGPGDEQKYSALWALNEVRNRAGIQPVSNVDKETLREIIWAERSRELHFEGHRWFDLIRTDRFVKVMNQNGVNASEKHKLYPIPQREIDINDKLIQNPGY